MEIVSIIAKTNTGELFDLPISELSSGGNSNVKKGVIPKGGEKGLVDSNIQELENGQVQLTKYTTDKSYIGNPVALLAYDGTGKIVSYPLFSGNKTPQTTTQVQEVSFSFKGTPQTISLFSDDGLEDSDIRRFPTGNYSLGGDNPFFKFELYRGSFNIVQLNGSDGFRMNGRLVLAVDMATNKITIGNATYNVVQMHTATLTGGVLNVVKEGNASNSINWTNLLGAVTDYLKPSSLGFELKSSLNAFTLSADMLNMTGNSIIATDRTAWMLAGNVATAQTIFGTTGGNFDIQILRNNSQVGMWRSGGLTVPNLIGSELTASELIATDSNKKLVSLAVATYPSLTELSYVKGVTSAIQTQLNAKFTLPSLTANYVTKSNGTTLANSQIFDNGTNVGIGHGSPNAKFHILGGSQIIEHTSGQGLTLYNNSDANRAGYFTVTGDGDFSNRFVNIGSTSSAYGFKFLNAVGTFLTITSTGAVGVGTTVPSVFFDVVGNTRLRETVQMQPSKRIGAGLDFGNGAEAGSGYLEFYNSGTGNTSLVNTTSFASITLHTNNVERFRITSNGNVGIGTTSPTEKLHVTGSILQTGFNTGLAYADATGKFVIATATHVNTLLGGSLTTNYVPKWNGSGFTNSQIFDNGTNVGVGTSSVPTYKLKVETSNWGAFQIVTTGSDRNSPALGFISGSVDLVISPDSANSKSWVGNYSNHALAFHTNNTERVSITSSGNVGIGTTSPNSLLDVYKSTGSELRLSSSDAASYGKIRFSSNNGSYLNYGATIEGTGDSSGVNVGDLRFSTGYGEAPVERMRISRTGNVGIGTTSPNQQLEITKNFRLPTTTYNSGNPYGIIYKDGNRFIHDFFYGNNGTVTTLGENTFIGKGSGNFTMGSTATLNYQGSYNTAVGAYSQQVMTTGYYNTSIGISALQSNSTGSFNTAMGSQSLYYNTTGSNNTAVGQNSLLFNTTGVDNVAVGLTALFTNTIGNQNVGVGAYALYDATTNTSNTAIGYNTGRGITTGSYNTIIGASVTGLSATLTNNIIIADGSGNRRINVDSSGNVGIGTTSPSYKLHTIGTTSTTDLNITNGASVNKYWVCTNATTGAGAWTALGSAGYLGTWNANTNTPTIANGTGTAGTFYITTTAGTWNSITFAVNDEVWYNGSIWEKVARNFTLVTATASVLGGIKIGSGLAIDGSGVASVIASLTTNVSGILPIANGGTGSATQNFVDLTTNQTVAGIKTFSVDGYFNGVRVGRGGSSVGGNTALGLNALNANTTGEYNTAIGAYALVSNTTGVRNNGVGMLSLNATTTGNDNVALGTYSLLANTTGSNNTAIGSYALQTPIAISNNTAIGFASMLATTTGEQNTAVGSLSLYLNTTGYYNTAIGFSSLYANTTGYNNNGFGLETLRYNTTGYQNTSIGMQSLYYNTTGANNVALGFQSLHLNTTGIQNSALSMYALYDVTTGSGNTAIGFNAGRGITTGSYNTIIGANVSGLSATLANNVIIADGAGNRRINVDSSGNVGLNITTITERLHVDGNIRYSGTLKPANVTPTTGMFLKADSASTNTWAAISFSDITGGGILAIASGGTGSSTKNFVDLTTTQASIGGIKTFTSNVNFTGGLVAYTNIGQTEAFDDATLDFISVGHFYNPYAIIISSDTASKGIIHSFTDVYTYNSSLTGLLLGTGLNLTNQASERLQVNGNIRYSGTLKPANTTPSSGQFLKADSTSTNTWASITTSDISGLSGVYLTTVSLTTNVTGILPIANGGTGSATQNFVDLTTDQTIAGIKTFSVDAVFNGVNIGSKGVVTSVILGASAGNDLTSGINNTFIGSYAGYSTTETGLNTFVGANSGTTNTSGYQNTFVGGSSGTNSTTGFLNSFFGVYSGVNNTTGNNNVFIGHESGYGNTTASNNVGVGLQSLYSNSSLTGGSNSALGNYSLAGVTTGIENTGIGYSAGGNNRTGSENIFLGVSAGQFTNSGGNLAPLQSIYIGNATKSSGSTRTNQIVIGYDTTGNASNTVTIGNSSITANFFSGTLKYGTLLKPNNVAGTNGQFLKTSGSQDSWASIGHADISNLSSFTGFDARYYTETETDSLLSAKQSSLSGTGFVKISGTTISYDNSTYLTTATAVSTYMPLVTGTIGQVFAYDGTNYNFMNLDHKPLKLNINEIAVGNEFGLLESRSEFKYLNSLMSIGHKTDTSKYTSFGMTTPTGEHGLIKVFGGGSLHLDGASIKVNHLGGSTLFERIVTVDQNGYLSAKELTTSGNVAQGLDSVLGVSSLATNRSMVLNSTSNSFISSIDFNFNSTLGVRAAYFTDLGVGGIFSLSATGNVELNILSVNGDIGIVSQTGDVYLTGINTHVGESTPGGELVLNGTSYKLNLANTYSGQNNWGNTGASANPQDGDMALFTYDGDQGSFVMNRVQKRTGAYDTSKTYLTLVD